MPLPGQALSGSVWKRFDEVARLRADHPAIVNQERIHTYSEIRHGAQSAAAAVIESLGTGAGQVGLVIRDEAASLAAIFGVLKAGKAYVPVDCEQPIHRWVRALRDAEVGLLLCDSSTRRLAERAATELGAPCLDTKVIGQCGTPDVTPDLGSPDALAYILYTSGSTGEPKGVMHSHRNILHAVMRHTTTLHVSECDRIAVLAAFTYSSALCHVFNGLLNGATLFPYQLKERGTGGLAAWMRVNRITFIQAVPTVFRHICQTLDQPEPLDDLRIVVLGGEPISRADVALFQRHFHDHTTLAADLGSTEVMPHRINYVTKHSVVSDAVLPAGYAVQDMDVLLLDDDLKPVPTGEAGEMFVRSDYLALGYWRRPDLTARAFLADPFDRSKRVFRTGDLARLDEDGCLHFLGRKDSMVKVRGNRVELHEIELTLLEWAEIDEAVVTPRREDNGDLTLVAHLVPRKGVTISISELRAFLRKRLPDYMVPQALIPMAALPLLPNGKLDRAALPRTLSEAPRAGDESEQSRGELEEQILAIWRAHLPGRAIGVRDNFFELGGYSLLAGQVVIEVEKAFGAQVPLASFLVNPTIERLAELAREGSGTASWSPLVKLQSRGTRTPFFCVHGIYGNGLVFTNLAQALGPEYPFYGLRAPELDGLQKPITSVPELARSYLAAVRSVQPEGPYLLGGYSFGGSVALEMAQQILQAGQTVRLLAILDHVPLDADYLKVTIDPHTWTVGFCRGLLASLPRRLCHDLRFGQDERAMLKLKMSALRGWLFGPRPDPLETPSEGGSIHTSSILENLPPHIRRPWEYQYQYWSTVPEDDRRRVVWEAQLQALLEYRPQPYPDRVTLLRTRKDPIFCNYDPYLGWLDLAQGGVDLHYVPGDHDSMLRHPRVSQTAEVLRAVLNTATTGAVECGVEHPRGLMGEPLDLRSH